MAKLDVSIDALADVLPFLSASCMVVGSAASPEGTNVVTLLVVGEAVPPVDRVTCEVEKSIGQDAKITVKFRQIKD